MDDAYYLNRMLEEIDSIAATIPSTGIQYADEELRFIYQSINSLILMAEALRAGEKVQTPFEAVTETILRGVAEENRPVNANPSTRDTHVGASDYSRKKIQPWDIWIEYGLNPWDADIVKRILRTKITVGISANTSRIEDYEKIQHVAQERIDQINNGDPYYKQSD